VTAGLWSAKNSVMRRLLLAAGLAAVATALGVALNAATSHAVPPPIYFGWWTSATPPVAGRAFTPVLVGHVREPASWKLSCSVSVHGQSVAAGVQQFHERRTEFWDRRSCSVYVPGPTAGNTLALTVTATDPNGQTFDQSRAWRIRSSASMTTVPLGSPQPVVSLAKFFSDTPPVAGRPFVPVFASQGTGGPWTLRCSATVHGHPVVVHRQEFGSPLSVPDIRTCAFFVARHAAGELLGVTVEATTPDGQTLHATRGWRILGNP
jgi:hypothetical protein